MRLGYLLATLMALASPPTTAAISSTMIVEMQEIISASVSPDGRLAVVGICHSNPRTDKREISWVIVPLQNGAALKTVSAGEEIFNPNTAGTLFSRQALWSRDSQWFFYLRRDGEEVQLWETRSDGSITRRVTNSTSDLIDLKQSSNPDGFLVQLSPTRASLRKAEDDEARDGILYSDHILPGFPLTETLPMIDRWRSVRRADNGDLVPPGWIGRTSALFDVRHQELKMNVGAMPAEFSTSENGSRRVKVLPLSPMPENHHNYVDKYTLQIEPKVGDGPVKKCEVAECNANRITIIGWSPDGEEVYYLADSLEGTLGSGFPRGAAIYAWNPRRDAVRLIHDSAKEGLWGRLYNLDTRSSLSLLPGRFAGREIVAIFSGADQPPRLEAINLDTGIARTLFDPNTKLRALTSGRAIWHTWETSTRYPGRGIMVLPDNYSPERRYPAIVTTYGCGNGFLRGGSGDNAPEFVLAHQGFIAICVDVPVGDILAGETDHARLYPIYCDIMTGLVADLTQEGKLDPSHVGLSGQSFGANAGAYCISHSKAFAAAAFRHGSAIERASWNINTPAWMRGPEGFYGEMQMPDPRNDPTGRWDAMSVARRASNINTPTLIQVDDAEYLGALPLWNAMREAGKAIEMIVFPKETHLLSHPIHMLVNFERQVDWFKFWLEEEEDASASKRDQYGRWHRLRELTRSRSQ